MIGSTISHYQILDKLGEGGMGVVYKAEDTKLERTVALKFLPAHLLGNEEVRKRFEREAKAAAALHHPNICPVYEIDEVEGKSFIAMAFLEGESLDKQIAQGPLKLDQMLAIGQQIAGGLEAAHKKGIFHRDVKPENVIVNDSGHVTVMDFGLAKLTEASRLTQAGETMGTVAYMSPEQTEGSGTDHRTDIWSLGVVLYEMITGQQPFKGDYEKAVQYSILNERAEPLTALRTGVPMNLERVVEKCLSKSPDERYQSASELAVDLRAAAKSDAQSQATMASRPAHPATTSPLRYWPIAAGVALVAAAVLFWASPWEEPTGPSQSWRIKRLTSTPAAEAGASASPASSLFVYAGAAAGSMDLYAMPMGGGKPLQLTSHIADDLYPALSPDGEQILFHSGRDGGGIYLVSVTGGVPRRIAANNMPGRAFAVGSQPWRVNGTQREVLFSRLAKDGRTAVWKIDMTSFEETRLSDPPDGAADFSASWSPDDSRIVFGRDHQGRKALRIMSADGGDERALLSGDGKHAWPSWTPDGKRIVFGSSRSGAVNLWELALATEELQQITVGPGIDMRPLAVDGKGLFYYQFQPTLDLMRLDLSTGDTEQLTFLSDVVHFNPRFSPDGRFLVYDRLLGVTNREIVRLDLSTGETRSLTGVPSTNSHDPDWSPASGDILFLSDRGGELALWLMDAEGRGARPLEIETGAPKPQFFIPAFIPPRWSPTGERIAYAGLGESEPELWSVRRDGSGAQLLVSGVFAFDWYGTTGRVIIYTTSASGDGPGGSQVRAIHLETGQEVVLLEGLYASLDVSPDSSALACLTQENHAGQHYLSFPLSSADPADGLPRIAGPPRRLTSSDGLWHTHSAGSFSPDGKSFVYDRDSDKGDVYLIENYQ